MNIRLIIVFLLAGIPRMYGQVTLATSEEEITIAELEYFIDELGSLTRIEAESRQFTTATSGNLIFEDNTGVIWLRFKLYNPYEQRVYNILEFTDPTLYEIVLYEGIEKPTYSGSSIHQNVKDYQGNNNAFLVDTGPGEMEMVYVRIYSNDFVTAEAVLNTEESYHQKEINQHVFLGIFYGVLVLIGLYSFFLYGVSRMNVFLLYAMYIFSGMLYAGIADGLTSMYLHSLVKSTLGFHEVIIETLTNIVALVFMLSFLQLKEWSNRLTKLVSVSAVTIVVLMASVLLIAPEFAFTAMRILSFANLVLILCVAVIAVKKKRSQARYFLASFTGFGVFVIISMLSHIGLIRFGFLVHYAIHFAILTNLVILSVALGVRIYRQMQKSIQQEREKQREFSSKNEELEKLVEDRTNQINKKESQLRSIIENSDNLIWLVNRDYVVLESNELFSGSWNQVFNRPLQRNVNILEQLENPVDRKKWRKRYDKVFSGKSTSFTEDYHYGDDVLSFEIDIHPIREDDQVIAAACFSRNITRQLEYEKELKDKNTALQQVNEELDSFVYSASHDLKAPLASIQGLIGLVRNETNEGERRTYYEMMDKSIRRLDQFIRDIIDYSRNTRIEVKSTEINLPEMVDDILEDLKFMRDDKVNVRFIANLEVPLMADPTRLRIILRNLLSNALSYGVREGEQPDIRVRWNIKKRKAIIEVCDKGPGIPEDHLARIFEMFYRANENSSGSGLGLYIVRESVRKLNGTVSVDSTPEGTCFRIAFPNSVIKN